MRSLLLIVCVVCAAFSACREAAAPSTASDRGDAGEAGSMTPPDEYMPHGRGGLGEPFNDIGGDASYLGDVIGPTR